MCRETFGQTTQLTMEYNEMDVSDDEQIVDEGGHDEQNEYEEPEDKSEDREDDEPADKEEDDEPEQEEYEEPDED